MWGLLQGDPLYCLDIIPEAVSSLQSILFNFPLHVIRSGNKGKVVDFQPVGLYADMKNIDSMLVLDLISAEAKRNGNNSPTYIDAMARIKSEDVLQFKFNVRDDEK